MFNFATAEELVLRLVLALGNAVLICLMAYKLIHIFQLSGYRAKGLAKWTTDRRNKFYIRLFALSLLSFGSMIVVNILFRNFDESTQRWSQLGLFFYLFFATIFIVIVHKEKARISLKFTSRVRRFYILLGIIGFFATMATLWLADQISHVRFALIAIFPVLLPWIVIMTHFIILPLESLLKWRFIFIARRKLNKPEYANLIKIGITGSFGKTSCKNILRDMLAKKYNVATSPSSYNTPMGFTRTVNNVLKPEHEILIMEMGARYRNDIKYLAKLVQPHHGILTSIGKAHLDTMKDLDGVKAIKGELIKALPPEGVGILNGDIDRCIQVHDEITLDNKHLVGLKDVNNINMTPDGCIFEFLGTKFTTQLLGLHNIQNIVMSAKLAHELGVSLDQIAEAVSELKPTPHRLELIKSSNGVTILDDSYNATPTGIAAALKVLDLFKGKKVVQTPGLVEMGLKALEENYKIGIKIAGVADTVIVVGEFNKQALTDGLLAAKFDKDNIHYAKTLDDAKALYGTLLKKGDTLLISNDLPDNYI